VVKDAETSPRKYQLEHSDLYAAPRSFDLATMLVVTSAFALLFTVMTLLDAPFGLFLYFAGLVTVVGIAQSLFSSKYNPRVISNFAGLAFHIAWTLVLVVLVLAGIGVSRNGDTWTFDWLICPMFAVTFVSPAVGYLSGALVAGTFLVADHLRGLLSRLHLSRNPADEPDEVHSPWDE